MKFIEIAGTTFAVEAIESLSFHPKAGSDELRPIRLKDSSPGTLIVGLKRGESVSLKAFQQEYIRAAASLLAIENGKGLTKPD
jgi:hypothetical protein